MVISTKRSSLYSAREEVVGAHAQRRASRKRKKEKFRAGEAAHAKQPREGLLSTGGGAWLLEENPARTLRVCHQWPVYSTTGLSSVFRPIKTSAQGPFVIIAQPTGRLPPRAGSPALPADGRTLRAGAMVRRKTSSCCWRKFRAMPVRPRNRIGRESTHHIRAARRASPRRYAAWPWCAGSNSPQGVELWAAFLLFCKIWGLPGLPGWAGHADFILPIPVTNYRHHGFSTGWRGCWAAAAGRRRCRFLPVAYVASERNPRHQTLRNHHGSEYCEEIHYG